MNSFGRSLGIKPNEKVAWEHGLYYLGGFTVADFFDPEHGQVALKALARQVGQRNGFLTRLGVDQVPRHGGRGGCREAGGAQRRV